MGGYIHKRVAAEKHDESLIMITRAEAKRDARYFLNSLGSSGYRHFIRPSGSGKVVVCQTRKSPVIIITLEEVGVAEVVGRYSTE